MELIYLLGIKCYGLAIHLAALFHPKAQQWVKGRRGWRKKLDAALLPGEKRILFHCASLGEFEQGRPLLEGLRKKYSDHKIVLTFFSPSGYNIRKTDPLADYVFYLPNDGPLNARDFVAKVNPSLVFFVKYEFWHFYLKALKKQKVPCYLVSAIFRPHQPFFLPVLSPFFKKMLKRYTHIFVQTQSSLELLYKNAISHVTVTGDTRFDRVYHNSQTTRELPEFNLFKGNHRLMVAGSTWPADEKLLASFYPALRDGFRLVIAPHETGEKAVNRVMRYFGSDAIRYSQWNRQPTTSPVLIIDSVGMLSSIYRYADVSYVGGGFGSGIHNILEAVVFGVPVFFGPRYHKFREAIELIHWKGAFSVNNAGQLSALFTDMMSDPKRLERIHNINVKYIENNKGSTDLIIKYLEINSR